MKGAVGLFALIVGLGLVLRFGKTSHALAGDLKDTAIGLTDALTLSKWPGNTP